MRELYRVINVFWGSEPNRKKTDKTEVHASPFLINPLRNWMGAGCSEWGSFNQIFMDKLAPQNGCFFVRFVTFTSTLLYRVVWNQSMIFNNNNPQIELFLNICNGTLTNYIYVPSCRSIQDELLIGLRQPFRWKEFWVRNKNVDMEG